MEKRKLAKIPREEASDEMVRFAERAAGTHIVTTRDIEKDLLMVTFYPIRKLKKGKKDAQLRTFFSKNDYISQDLTVEKVKWTTCLRSLSQHGIHSQSCLVAQDITTGSMRLLLKIMWNVSFGGLCFLFCGSINEFLRWDMLIWKQMFICAVGITAIEFLSGYILNIVLGLGIWDYSNMPFNIIGQICLPFTVAWYILSLLAIVLDDHLRYWIFGEEKPRYKWR